MPSSRAEYQFLESSLRSLDKAKRLTTQLLTFSRGGDPIIKAASLKGLIEAAQQNILQGSNIQTSFNFSPDLWLVAIDQAQMNQVLYNLFTNVKEAMPNGGNLSIHAENMLIEEDNTTLTGGKYVKISVRDEGVGIAPDIQGKIFDPYFSTKTKGADKGTGMGLAVCLSIITKHKGQITVESIPGKETTFTLLLPASVDDKKTSDGQNRRNQKDSSKVRRILILEDEEEVSRVVGMMLERMGYESEIVEDGRKAVELYREFLDSSTPFNLVILDLTIHGGMGGRETMEQLRKIDPQVKAIVASGYTDDIVMSNFEAYGFIASLAKPYSKSALKEKLKQYC